MNWTGGRLNQNSRYALNKLLRVQKEHFAKARLSRQQTSVDIYSPSFLLPRTLTRSDNEPGTGRTRPHDTNHSPVFTAQPLRGVTTGDNSFMNKARGVQGQNRQSISSSQSCNSLQLTKQKLLERPDWTGITTTQPSCSLAFPGVGMQRLGRPRKRVSAETIGRKRGKRRTSGRRPRKRQSSTTMNLNKESSRPVTDDWQSASFWSDGPNTQGTDRGEDQFRSIKAIPHEGNFPDCCSNAQVAEEDYLYGSRLVSLQAARHCSNFDQIKSVALEHVPQEVPAESKVSVSEVHQAGLICEQNMNLRTSEGLSDYSSDFSSAETGDKARVDLNNNSVSSEGMPSEKLKLHTSIVQESPQASTKNAQSRNTHGEKLIREDQSSYRTKCDQNVIANHQPPACDFFKHTNPFSTPIRARKSPTVAPITQTDFSSTTTAHKPLEAHAHNFSAVTDEEWTQTGSHPSAKSSSHPQFNCIDAFDLNRDRIPETKEVFALDQSPGRLTLHAREQLINRVFADDLDKVQGGFQMPLTPMLKNRSNQPRLTTSNRTTHRVHLHSPFRETPLRPQFETPNSRRKAGSDDVPGYFSMANYTKVRPPGTMTRSSGLHHSSSSSSSPQPLSIVRNGQLHRVTPWATRNTKSYKRSMGEYHPENGCEAESNYSLRRSESLKLGSGESDFQLEDRLPFSSELRSNLQQVLSRSDQQALSFADAVSHLNNGHEYSNVGSDFKFLPR